MEYIQYIKSIPSEEGKQAELALYRRQPDEAERILLQASPPLAYRAIKLNLNLFRWNRALDLAVKHKAHIETVLAYRQKYLQSFEREEVNQKFLQYFNQVNDNIGVDAFLFSISLISGVFFVMAGKLPVGRRDPERKKGT